LGDDPAFVIVFETTVVIQRLAAQHETCQSERKRDP